MLYDCETPSMTSLTPYTQPVGERSASSVIGRVTENWPAVPSVFVTPELGMAMFAPEFSSQAEGVKVMVPVDGSPSGVRKVPRTTTVVVLAGRGISYPPRLQCGR